MKRRTLLLLIACLLAVCVTAVSEGDSRGVRTESTKVFGELAYPVNPDKAASDYILRAFGLKSDRADGTIALTGANARILKDLTEITEEVAAGKRSSTAYSIKVTDLTSKIAFTETEMGMGFVEVSQELIDQYAEVLFKSMGLDVPKVVGTLKANKPYEMYWFSNMYGYWISGCFDIVDNKFTCTEDTELVVEMIVSSDYSVNGEKYTTKYDTSYGKRINAAAENAKGIVKNNAGKSDAQKLKAYKKAICDAVTYDDDAAAGKVPYGDPWQAVSVFDNDPKTNVVCEGYSKAFKYLCDLSSFRQSVSVSTVAGDMVIDGSGGAHMWNLVNINGTRYLADITNCDSGCIGAPDALFMAGYVDKYKSGSKWGYVYSAYGYPVTYIYDRETTGIYASEDLTVTDKEFNENDPEIPMESPTPTPSSSPSSKPGTTPTPKPSGTPEPGTVPEGPYSDSTGKYDIGSDGTATYKKPAKSKATLVIPDTVTVNGVDVPVTAIADKAFSKDKKLKTVTIGSNIRTIGKNAFNGCENLKTVKGGNGVEVIKDSAFSGCVKLAKLPSFPKLKTIGASAFKGCTSLTKVTIGANVNAIGKNAFSGCAKLKTITIKSTLLTKKNVKSGAFKGIGAKATVKCPKAKLKEYKKFLPKKGVPKTAKIK